MPRANRYVTVCDSHKVHGRMLARHSATVARSREPVAARTQITLHLSAKAHHRISACLTAGNILHPGPRRVRMRHPRAAANHACVPTLPHPPPLPLCALSHASASTKRHGIAA
jgi:hypothetical protein